MRAMRLLLALASLVLGASLAAASDTPRRVALVIGNGAYSDVPKLPNPPSDAAAIGQVLKDVGFTKVTVVTDLTHQGLFDALRQFSADSATADWSVLYYAGHGIEVDGKNYLVPIDAHLAFDRDVEFEAVSMQTVLAAVGGARQLKLVILDACRDDPFLTKMRRASSSRAIARGLARVEPEGKLFVVYSAQSGQVALDANGGGERSPFVEALLKNIETPGLEVNLLFRKVRDDVERVTNGEQVPATEGTLPGEELYFKPARPVAKAEPLPPPSELPAELVAPQPPQTRVFAVEAAPKPPEPAETKPHPPLVTATLEQPPPATPVPAPPDAKVTAMAVQNELRRVGCDAGPANGLWTIQSRMALLTFSQHTDVTLDVDKPDIAALNALRSQRGIVCPPVIRASPNPHASMPARASLEPEPARPARPPVQRRPVPHVVQRVEVPVYVRPVRPARPAPSRAGGGSSCFPFNGQMVCE